MQNISIQNMNEKIIVMQKLNCQRLVKLQRADPVAFADYKHFQTIDPFLWKSDEEKIEIEIVMRKYANLQKMEESESKRSAVFEANVEDLDSISSASCYTAASSSEFLDSGCNELFFSVEEIDQLSDADKYIYMNKLQNDYSDLESKIADAIQKVDVALEDC